MLVIAACVVALVSPLVVLRWSRSLLVHRWRAVWTIWTALALQVLLVRVTLPDGVAPALHVATYVVALGFLWANRRAPGVAVVGAGAASNGVTIALNGGRLPASPAAVAASGQDGDAAFANTGVVQDPVLLWLGDIFAWPAPLPLANTFSVGDVLIVLGVVVAAWTGTQPLRRSRRGSAPGGPDEGDAPVATA